MRRAIIFLVVLAVLAVAVDRIAKAVVQGVLADRIASTAGADKADVTITGFPFLTQVLDNHFDKVEVSIPSLAADAGPGSLEVRELQLTLRNVETSDRYRHARAQSVTGSGVVPYATFDAFGSLQVSYGGKDSAGSYLTISVPEFGQTVKVRPQIANGTNLDLSALDAIKNRLPAGLRHFVDTTYAFSRMPDGLTIDHVAATPGGLRILVEGTGVEIAA